MAELPKADVVLLNAFSFHGKTFFIGGALRKPVICNLTVLFLIILLQAEAYAVGVKSITPLEYRFESIVRYLESSLPENAKWSFTIGVPGKGERLSEQRFKQDGLSPASLVKLYVTALALDINHQERVSLDTIISIDGKVKTGELHGNLYVKGTGNAFLSMDDFSRAMNSLKERGISSVRGDVVADDSYFDGRRQSLYGDGPAYAAPGALGLDLHTVFVSVDGRSKTSTVLPENESALLEYSSGIKSVRKISDTSYLLPHRSDRKRFGLNHPALYTSGALKEYLKANDITVNGNAIVGITPSEATIVAVIPSKDLKEIVKEINSYSINVMSENLLLHAGALKYGPPGTMDKGFLAIEEFLSKKGIAHAELLIADGSGLSHDNRLTSESVFELLNIARNEPWFGTFFSSLAMPGESGTLKHHKSMERVHVKTGQTERVFSLAGYMDCEKSDMLAFCLVVNVDGADLLNQTTDSLLEIIVGKPC